MFFFNYQQVINEIASVDNNNTSNNNQSISEINMSNVVNQANETNEINEVNERDIMVIENNQIEYLDEYQIFENNISSDVDDEELDFDKDQLDDDIDIIKNEINDYYNQIKDMKDEIFINQESKINQFYKDFNLYRDQKETEIFNNLYSSEQVTNLQNLFDFKENILESLMQRIEKIKLTSLFDKSINNLKINDYSNFECPICLDHNEKQLVSLFCNHKYHKECLEKWIFTCMDIKCIYKCNLKKRKFKN